MKSTLANCYTVNRHFQRAKRLDTDLALEGLEGYQLNQTAWHILDSFSEDVARGKQRAFTWTGPYGSGKSSLALVLAALLGPQKGGLRSAAGEIILKERAKLFYQRMPVSRRGWLVVCVVGRRESPISAIWSALIEAWRERWGDDSANSLALPGPRVSELHLLTKTVETAARKASAEGDGLLVIVDEMGKFLEFAALNEGDLYPFQEIAELMSRTEAHCAFLGILHQSFDEYSRKGSRATRSEWSKIQGRFSDTPFSIAIEEVVGLIGNALNGPVKRQPIELAQKVAAAISTGRFGRLKTLPATLSACAPLHPLSALLLGPISRRRFGQNERSVFSFLSSREPHSFGDFLEQEPANSKRLFSVTELWNYLQANHEQTILASPDGARWAEAAEAILRVSRRSDSSEYHIAVLKCIAVLDLFGAQFGLGASDALVTLAFQNQTAAQIAGIIRDLKSWSAIISRRHAGGWGIFAGSDIDIEAETDRAREAIAGDLDQIFAHLPDLSPIVAKRHYADKGTLRVFGRAVVRAGALIERTARTHNLTGQFLLVVGNFTEAALEGSDPLQLGVFDPTTLLSFIPVDHPIVEQSLTVAALERVQATIPQLEGDPVARRELVARLSQANNQLTEAIEVAFAEAKWDWPWYNNKQFKKSDGMSQISSDVCDMIFVDCPVVVNELLNRERPSSSAVAARRRLAYAMISANSVNRLAIEGEPAELGLYLSLLEYPGIHSLSDDGKNWVFQRPTNHGFQPMWDGATTLLKKQSAPISLNVLYAHWSQPPFGMRAGIEPVLALAFVLANQGSIALYVDGNFTTQLDDLFIDRLLQAPENISLRWVQASKVGASAIDKVAEFVKRSKLGSGGITALEVTKPLVEFAFRLPGWVRRTRQLTQTTLNIRDALLNARDPYALLFFDLPYACNNEQTHIPAVRSDPAEGGAPSLDVEKLGIAVEELRLSQETLLKRFRDILARALLADLDTSTGLHALIQRASVVAAAPETKTDLRITRFAQILARVDTDVDWLEAACSLAASRPLKDWSDPDVGRAVLEIGNLAEQFGQVEATVQVASSKDPRLLQASQELIKELENRGLDSVQQRAALLYALKQISDTKIGKAA